MMNLRSPEVIKGIVRHSEKYTYSFLLGVAGNLAEHNGWKQGEAASVAPYNRNKICPPEQIICHKLTLFVLKQACFNVI